MPEYLRLMDLGLFFIKVCFSKKGASATKMGEFLATGIPVVINDGVGDSGRIVREHRAGVVLSRMGLAEFEASSMRYALCCATRVSDADVGTLPESILT